MLPLTTVDRVEWPPQNTEAQQLTLMPLLRLDKVSLNFGTHILFDEIELTLMKGSKIGLLGRNGAGKTTLMKIIAGSVVPDGGERWLRPITTLPSKL